MPRHIYSHSRILQLVACSSPQWVVIYDPQDDPAIDPFFAMPIHCFALIEQWESHDWQSRLPAKHEDRIRVVVPVTSINGDMEPEESKNIADIVTVWPLTPEQRASLLLSKGKK